jgi:hypothetical protein
MKCRQNSNAALGIIVCHVVPIWCLLGHVMNTKLSLCKQSYVCALWNWVPAHPSKPCVCKRCMQCMNYARLLTACRLEVLNLTYVSSIHAFMRVMCECKAHKWDGWCRPIGTLQLAVLHLTSLRATRHHNSKWPKCNCDSANLNLASRSSRTYNNMTPLGKQTCISWRHQMLHAGSSYSI